MLSSPDVRVRTPPQHSMRRGLLLLALLAGVGGSKLDNVARNNAFIGYTETKGKPCVVEDRDAQCPRWASSGECARNPSFMMSTCAKSCGAPCEPEADDRLAKHANVGAVVFHTAQGDIRVRLREDLSPVVAGMFKAFASKPGASGSFYRSEAIPEPGAVDNFGGPGPPYALVQGRLDGNHRNDLPREGAPKVRRGHACLIGGGPDFFIAVGPHPEWGNGHTVWGEVDLHEMGAVDAITALDVKKETWGETHVTVLVHPLRFELSFEPPGWPGTLAKLRGAGSAILSDVDR